MCSYAQAHMALVSLQLIRRRPGDLFCENTGEILSSGVAHSGGRFYHDLGVSFLYFITKTVSNDARYKGNGINFINHRRMELDNAEAKLVNVSAQNRVVMTSHAPLAARE